MVQQEGPAPVDRSRITEADLQKHEETKGQFFKALGEFVLQFSWTEKDFIDVLARQVGVNNEGARAVFSGTRLKQAVNYLNRLTDRRIELGAARKSDYSLLHAAFVHALAINDIRDQILHWDVMFWLGEGAARVHNLRTARTMKARRVYPVSIQDVRDMIQDLQKIRMALLVQFPPKDIRLYPHVHEIARGPWRYKPPPQAKSQQPRLSRPKRQVLPAPSPKPDH